MLAVAVAACTPWTLSSRSAIQRLNTVEVTPIDYSSLGVEWTLDARAFIASLPAFARRDNAEGRRLLNEARAKLTAVPVTEAQANDPAIASAFRATRPDRPAAGRQAQFEEEWDRHAVAAYAEAKRLAEQAQRAR